MAFMSLTNPSFSTTAAQQRLAGAVEMLEFAEEDCAVLKALSSAVEEDVRITLGG